MPEIQKKLLKNENLQKEFNVIIPIEVVKENVENKLLELQKTYKVDGFRPGKVSIDVIRKREADRLFMQCGETLINNVVSEFIDEDKRALAFQPKVDVKSFDLDTNIEINVILAFLPELDNIDFSSITLEKYNVEVSKNELDENVNRLMKEQKTHTELPVETIAKLDNVVRINYLGKVDGEVFQGGAADGYELKLGSHSFIDNFEEQLVGKKAGDKVEVKVNFPKEYHSVKLAGKPAIFDVEVVAVLQEEEQVLNDEFVKQAYNLDKVEIFLATLKKEIEKQYENSSKQNLHEKLFVYLKENINLEIPQILEEEQFNAMWKSQEQEFVNNPKLLEEKSKEEFEKEIKIKAKNSIKIGLILSHEAEKNNIQVTEDEVMQELTSKALSMPGYEKMFLDYYTKNKEMLNNLKASVLEDKIVEFILSKINIIEASISSEDFKKLQK